MTIPDISTIPPLFKTCNLDLCAKIANKNWEMRISEEDLVFNDDSLAGDVFGDDIGAEEDPTANGEDIKPCQFVL